MRVCLMIEGQEGVTWDQWRALATTAEEHGFEALFRSDHYQSLDGSAPQGSLDAWATINALAAITSTIRLGTLVSPATFRHPSTLAREVVTADHVSNGRVELGLGAGWHEGEHRSHGFPFETTKDRFNRLAEIIESNLLFITGERCVPRSGLKIASLLSLLLHVRCWYDPTRQALLFCRFSSGLGR